MKRCNICEKSKSLEDFHKGSTKDGRRSICIECRGRPDSKDAMYRKTPRAKELHRLAKEKYRKTPKGILKTRDNHLSFNYGISHDDTIRMYDKQQGKCAMNNEEISFQQANVDHNHRTGKVRALLCRKCNMILGVLESETWKQKTKKYLQLYDE